MRGLTLRDPGFLGSLKKFLPTEYGVSVWFDASDASTVVASGSPLKVSQWTEKSVGTLNLVQATPASQPTYDVTSINGLASITFSGSNGLARLNANLFANRSGATIFVIAQGTVSTVLNKGIFMVRTSASVTPSNATRGQVVAVSGQIQSGGRRLDADAYQSVNASSVSDNVPFMAGAVLDWQNAQLWTNLNGALTQRSGGFQTAGVTSNTSDDISIGRNTIDNGNPFTGSIGEIIVYPRVLSTLERNTVESYLRSKWGTP